MKQLVRHIVVITLSLGCAVSQAFSEHNIAHAFEIEDIAETVPLNAPVSVSKHFEGEKVLRFSPGSQEDALTICDKSNPVNWSSAAYLVCDLYHENNYNLILYFDFFKKGIADRAPYFYIKVMVLPKLKTRVVFPLSYLDAQRLFLPRFQRQLKGGIVGHRMELEEISKVNLRIEPFQSPEFIPIVEIHRIYLTGELPEFLPPVEEAIVDEFGQWTMKSWEGKVISETDLKTKLLGLENELSGSQFPGDWSKYGGWKRKFFGASGFFRTYNDGTRWWLVDPDGYAFISVGSDCIRDSTGTIKSDELNDLFKWFPPENDPAYNDCYTGGGNRELVDFFRSNLVRVYGKNWHNKWEELTINLMKEYRFNTIANWSDIDFARNAKIPYVLPLRGFPDTEIKLFRDFPDVFDPVYQQGAVGYADQLKDFKDDPYLIGYFLENEPHWAFGEFNLAFEMFATPQESFTKKEIRKWLTEKYNGDLDKFNSAWGLNLKSFAGVEHLILKDTTDLKSSALDELMEFSGIMVEQYVKVVCAEVKKVDPNHLNLGMRYAWISSDLCYRAGEYFDVFSINGYSNPGPPDTREVAERSGKPVMIGEFHFGAVDRGLPATGIQGAESQTARGNAYRYYVEQGLSRPEIIGLHHFQWLDQPVTGRSDGENYNIGFLTITHQPYQELLDAAKTTHERMYQVVEGEIQPFDVVIKKIPQISMAL